jgi:signal transduction histidine kinase
VARHAEASRVHIELDTSGTALELRVRDDGRGFNEHRRRNGLGLDGMAERARLVGGELEIESVPGAGTELVMRVP